MKYLADVMYPDAEKIISVMDNLNTYKPASFYKRYPPDKARCIIKKTGNILHFKARQLAGHLSAIGLLMPNPSLQQALIQPPTSCMFPPLYVQPPTYNVK